MTDYEEAAKRHAREVAGMSDEDVRLELEAAGVSVEDVRARFRAMRGASKRPRRMRIFFLAAAAALFVAVLAIVLGSLSNEPPPIAPIPAREPTPNRVVEHHQDLVAPQGDAGAPKSLPALPPR